jgi:hypothetical protein
MRPTSVLSASGAVLETGGDYQIDAHRDINNSICDGLAASVLSFHAHDEIASALRLQAAS